jgi:hypothetical protein
MDGIYEKQRHTVCKIGHKHQAALICYQAVYILIIPLPENSFSSVPGSHSADIGGVGLMGSHHVRDLAAQNLSDSFIIFQDIFSPIPPLQAEVHGGKFLPAHASQAGGKKMPHPPCLLQGGKGQILQFFPAALRGGSTAQDKTFWSWDPASPWNPFNFLIQYHTSDFLKILSIYMGKGILHPLYLFPLDAHHVIAHAHIVPQLMEISVIVRRPAYPALFAVIHRGKSVARPLGFPKFYLHKYQISLMITNQVNLPVSAVKI